MLSQFLPLQWAIDSQWIAKTTGQTPAAPQAWLYTNIDNDDYDEKTRVKFMIATRGALVLSFIVNFVFIAYQLAGSIATERAEGLTELLETMGCSTTARILSWHLSVTLVNVPSFIIMAVMYCALTFNYTPYAYMVVMYLVVGISIASWTFFIAVPFARKPTLAAIAALGFCVIGAVIGILIESNAAGQCILTLIFPSSLIVYTHRIAASFEIPRRPFSWTSKSPNGDVPVIALVILGLVNIVIWPVIAAYLERALFSLPSTHGPLKKNTHADMPDNVAVRVDHLRKSYDSKRFFFFGKAKSVVAIEDLSFSIPRGEIFCLLGCNGAAKSTTLGCIAGLVRISSGSVRYAEDLRIGIAGQKDVLWDDLNCEEHVRLWRAIKGLDNRDNKQIDKDLIEGCNLAPKLKSLSKTLSGGQKRKLQLACAIAGGSNLLLLDEISSGLDPLSRRAIWKIITAHRGDATIVLTTHFLDEADYLGDEIAILRAPGQLLAVDNPVELKTRMGRGFHVSVEDTPSVNPRDLLEHLRQDDADVTVRPVKGRHLFSTGSNSLSPVRRIIRRLEQARQRNLDLRYQIGSTTLEEVFIDLNSEDLDSTSTTMSKPISKVSTTVSGDEDIEMQLPFCNDHGFATKKQISLCSPKPRSWWLLGSDMAWTVLRKRLMIFRRAWLIPVAAVLAVILVGTIPLVFMDGRSDTCNVATETKGVQDLTFPNSPYRSMTPLLAVNDATLGSNWTGTLGQVQAVDSRDAFVSTLRGSIKTSRFGGWSLQAMPGPDAIVAYEGDYKDEDDDKSGLSQLKGLSAFNAYANSVLEQIRPAASAFRINLKWDYIPYAGFSATGKVLLWVTFFGAIMAIWPAFAAIYPSNEKTSGVRINQYSNGARPASLWAGHLLFELPGIFICATVLTIVFAAVKQFKGLGYLWLCLVLYGISSTIYGFLFSLRFKTSLGSWAVIASVNMVLFLYYIVMYQIVQLSTKTATADNTIFYGHLGYAAAHPLLSILRAAFVSVNIFSLRCDGRGNPTTRSYGDMRLFGAPIIYMIVQGILAFLLLVWFDSNRPMPHWLRRKRKVSKETSAQHLSEDVLEEKNRIDNDASDALIVNSLTKQFPGTTKPSVDNVTFGVDTGQNFALIGPNGAGKTTALGCIRGVTLPSRGDVLVNGSSITRDRNDARISLGVCPQHSAIDAHLTVREHLWLYGAFKGVPQAELERDICTLLAVSGLSAKADEFASSLSGGNQRKLSLMMALIGDRPVILIDEFSSGVDPFSKREAWQVLAALTAERAVIMTTHSMEEVDALSSRVGIIAAKLLGMYTRNSPLHGLVLVLTVPAVGTPSSLKSRYSTYEVHLLAEQVGPLLEYLHQHDISATSSDDTLTRVTLPGIREDRLDHLLGVLLAAEKDLGLRGIALQE
jgi:ABC-type multidrug transport system ATPase subunit